MSLLTFFLLLFVAAVAAGVIAWAVNAGWRIWVAYFFAFALLLVLPVLLPKLLGG
jgi:hypothetical protein